MAGEEKRGGKPLSSSQVDVKSQDTRRRFMNRRGGGEYSWLAARWRKRGAGREYWMGSF